VRTHPCAPPWRAIRVSQPQMYALSRGHEKAPSSRDDAPTPDAVGHPAEHASDASRREVSQGSRPLD